MQTTLYTPAGQPAQPNAIVTDTIADLNAAAAALQRAAYGLAFPNNGEPTQAAPLADMVRDLSRNAIVAAGGPMSDTLELSEMVEGFRDNVATAELAAMQQRSDGAPRPRHLAIFHAINDTGGSTAGVLLRYKNIAGSQP